MSEGNQIPGGSSERSDWREMRRAERRQRREGRGDHGWGGPWIGGVVLIVLGVLFLMQNFGWQLPKNWWAAFILIPALGSLMAARRSYETNGGALDATVLGPGVVAAPSRRSGRGAVPWRQLGRLLADRPHHRRHGGDGPQLLAPLKRADCIARRPLRFRAA